MKLGLLVFSLVSFFCIPYLKAQFSIYSNKFLNMGIAARIIIIVYNAWHSHFIDQEKQQLHLINNDISVKYTY